MPIDVTKQSVDYPRTSRAIQQIYADYGDIVSISEKNKPLVKFGRNDALGTTTQDVWYTGGTEVYPTGNTIDTIVSTAADTQVVVVEGHTVADDQLTFVTQMVTLTGTSPATLSTPLHRCTRAYNFGSTDFAGIITITDSTSMVTHLTIPIGDNQSLKAMTSLSSQDYWILTAIACGVGQKTSARADFELRVRQRGKVFRHVRQIQVGADGGLVFLTLDPCVIVPPNSDVKFDAVASTTNVSVTAYAAGHLAIITG